MRKLIITGVFVLIFGISSLLAGTVFAMSPPIGQQVRYYELSESPKVTNDFSTSEPVAFGPAALGGNMLVAQVGLTQLLFLGDIYIAYVAASNPQILNILNPDNSFTPYDLAFIAGQISLGIPPPMVQPWRANTTGGFNVTVLQTATSNLPPDVYTVYMLLAPPGTFASFYLWVTYFLVPGF
jgi:hypothetical protein